MLAQGHTVSEERSQGQACHILCSDPPSRVGHGWGSLALWVLCTRSACGSFVARPSLLGAVCLGAFNLVFPRDRRSYCHHLWGQRQRNA